MVRRGSEIERVIEFFELHFAARRLVTIGPRAVQAARARRRCALLNNVDPISSLSGRTVTGGRLNVCKAIPACASPTPDFSLSVSPSSQSVVQGSTTGAYTVSIARTGGFTGAVTFSASGLPAGATPTFSPNPASGASSSLTIATAASTEPGSYPFTITGTSGTLPAHTAGATLIVDPGDQ